MREVESSTWKNIHESQDEAQKKLYEKLRELAARITCEIAYPSSILDGVQTGRIFVDQIENPQAAIFWHYCGMAYVVGETSDVEFQEALFQMVNGTYEKEQKNFYLIVPFEAENWIVMLDSFLPRSEQIRKGERLSFCFQKEQLSTEEEKLPEGFSYFEIEEKHLPFIKGRVIPSYSWESIPDYFRYGKGFGIYDDKNQKIASTAFSSGIGAGRIDIGIETQPDYRRKGFASIIARKMASYVVKQGLIPDWGCDGGNPASAATARHAGFVLTTKYAVYTKR